MTYPNQLLYDIYWSFNERHEDLKTFKRELKSYHREVSTEKIPVDPESLVLPSNKVVIQFYIAPDEDEEDDEDFVDEDRQIQISSDEPTGFTAGELLFKLNNRLTAPDPDPSAGPELATYDLTFEDKHFFEGLEYLTDDDPDFNGVPVYMLNLGS